MAQKPALQARHGEVRNRAFIMVLLATGLRLNEVLQLKLGDLDRVSGEVTVLGKGNGVRTVRLGARPLKALRDNLRLRPSVAPPTRCGSLGTGRPSGTWGAQATFRRLKARTGIERLRAQLLRHTFAQTARLKGAEREHRAGHTGPHHRRHDLAVCRGGAAVRLAAQRKPAVAPV